MKKPDHVDKLRGGYYTPATIASFLVDWAIRTGSDSVLEPSCGDGAFLQLALNRLSSIDRDGRGPGRLLGVEELASEAEAARASILGHDVDSARVVEGDFFGHAEELIRTGARFDAVLGNPPFIRYQTFAESSRLLAFKQMQEMGLTPNRMTNAWVPFLAVGARLLSDTGRLAMVIPAELLQVDYAAEIRRFLADQFARISLVVFDDLIFPDIQQETVLLLAERSGPKQHGIRVVSVRDARELETGPKRLLGHAKVKPIMADTEKWTKYFLEKTEIELLREMRAHPSIHTTHDYLDVDVGVVTGQNDFFVVSKDEIQKFQLDDFVIPMAGRSMQLRGLRFSGEDWSGLANDGKRVHLLAIKPSMNLNHDGLRAYIEWGEEQGFHTGYKCRIRKKWYCVPSIWVPDLFMLRQVGAAPRMVANEARAACTDTLHRVRLIGPANAEQVAVGFTNSLTLAFSEVTGRSYGGGVMTFEPSEAERLLVPKLETVKLELQAVDSTYREQGSLAVLDEVDKTLLRDQMGLSARECSELRAIWEKLRDRRLHRKTRRRVDSA